MATEVFNNIGESEIYSENSNFHKRQDEENEGFETSDKIEKIESISKPVCEAKKEFFKHLSDDSLTIDTCSKINHYWKKK